MFNELRWSKHEKQLEREEKEDIKRNGEGN